MRLGFFGALDYVSGSPPAAGPWAGGEDLAQLKPMRSRGLLLTRHLPPGLSWIEPSKVQKALPDWDAELYHNESSI